MKATQEFVKQFDKDVKAIGKAEASVKELLSMYSRSLLEALHQDKNEAGELISDIRLVNGIIEVLKTTNRKVAILFFKEFSGFRYDETLNKFTTKDKVLYAKKQEAAIAFLEDPNNNIWSWADRNVEIAPKPLDTKQITANVQKWFKKAENDGIKKSDVIKAIMDAGVTIEEVADVLGYAINQ